MTDAVAAAAFSMAEKTARMALVGQPSSPFTKIKDAAAARGIKFGFGVKAGQLTGDAAYAAIVFAESNMLSPEADMQPKVVWTAPDTYDFTRADAFVAVADAHNLPFRFSAGMIYPAGDPTWIATVDGAGVIVPVQPNYLTSANWQSAMDGLLTAWRARPYATRFTTLNVSNELTDPNQTDGWRRHQWYNAAGGPQWLVHAFQKCRELWGPSMPLYLCQDVTEQQLSGTYYDLLAQKFITNLQWLIAQGAPIDGVDLQGHLAIARFWNPAKLKSFLQQIKDLGLKIVVGECDIRTGNTGSFTPASYSTTTLDSVQATLMAQYLETIIPFISGGEFIAWDAADSKNSWGVNERCNIFDSTYTPHPAMYRAFLNAFKWSS